MMPQSAMLAAAEAAVPGPQTILRAAVPQVSSMRPISRQPMVEQGQQAKQAATAAPVVTPAMGLQVERAEAQPHKPLSVVATAVRVVVVILPEHTAKVRQEPPEPYSLTGEHNNYK